MISLINNNNNTKSIIIIAYHSHTHTHVLQLFITLAAFKDNYRGRTLSILLLGTKEERKNKQTKIQKQTKQTTILILCTRER